MIIATYAKKVPVFIVKMVIILQEQNAKVINFINLEFDENCEIGSAIGCQECKEGYFLDEVAVKCIRIF